MKLVEFDFLKIVAGLPENRAIDLHHLVISPQLMEMDLILKPRDEFTGQRRANLARASPGRQADKLRYEGRPERAGVGLLGRHDSVRTSARYTRVLYVALCR